MAKLRAVIDTNVLFEGLTKKDGAARLIIEAWSRNIFEACVSNALAYEYIDVLSRKLSNSNWEKLESIVNYLIALSTYVDIQVHWRPITPDPNDDFIVDCVKNSQAVLISHNSKDFRLASEVLKFELLTAEEFLKKLLAQSENTV